ncbi:MAG: hypothetical protein CMM58_05415 [Rhodospirillaceae bacterium]|nr:hypothetical protein [Rhodospirillaceae bacterium]|tara:strand:- start:1468 stop:1911 length:444 start_codon:yes stop_codon:yes gene_type:complete
MITGLKHQKLAVFVKRKKWLQKILDECLEQDESDIPDLHLHPQASGLLLESMNAFCSARWLTVIILSQAILDAALLKSENLDGTAINNIRTGRDFVWLRNRRNNLLHADCSHPAVTIHSFEVDNLSMEREARKAMELVLNGLTDTIL